MSGNNDTRQAPADEGQSRNNDWPADPERLRVIKAHGEPKTIGIIGSRRRKSKADYHQLHAAVMGIYNDGDAFVSGGCPQGGDFFAEGIAKRAGATITIHHPNWEKHGRSAGMLRNGAIALDADVLVALVAADRKGGTEDTIRKYLDLGKGNLIILEEGEKSPSPAQEPEEEAPAQEPTGETTVTHITQPYDAYIGRRGHGQDGYFGNPHPVGKPCVHCNGETHDRAGAIEAFREDFEKRIETDTLYRQRVLALKGQRLGCFCAPRACHGDVIADWLNHVQRQEELTASIVRP